MIRRGFFRPEVERFLERFFRLGVGIIVATAFLITLAWGYEQRRQAQIWRDLACAQRLGDLGRRATFLAVDEQTPDACVRLDELGVSLRSPGFATAPIINGASRP